jgi:hypothetical protein
VQDAFTGRRIRIEDMIAEGDRVWVRVATGSPAPDPPPGTAVPAAGAAHMGVYGVRLAGGRVAGDDVAFDLPHALMPRGAPAPPPV